MGPVHYHAGDFPPRDIDGKRLVPRLNPTATAVARYDGMLAAVPNPTILLSPLTTQEAALLEDRGERPRWGRCSSLRRGISSALWICFPHCTRRSGPKDSSHP